MQTITEHEELFYRLALTFVPGIGSRTGRLLLERFGSATEVFKTGLRELKFAEGVGETKARGFKDTTVFKCAEKELNFVSKNNIQTLSLGQDYPTRLNNCADAPLLLYYKGNADINAARIVAVVGTRKNSDYGQKLCEELIEGLQTLDNLLVISGLALGIDAIAHKKCVTLGIPTIGILGHGLDRIYPPTNKALADQMTGHGGILSEFPSDTVTDRNNFPMRNRIVAGMSDVTVVVESHITGGALITAAMAAGYNRDVAAFPGRVSDTRSAGCNELIRSNTAAMITKADDLIQLMNWDKQKKPKAVQQQLFLQLTPDEQKIIDLLQTRDNVHADELFHHSGMPNSMLAATLLQLEMQGVIKSLPGKLYRMH
jgi:DNA processing protein